MWARPALAAEYAYRHRSDFDVVWWVRADEPVTLAQDLADLAPAIGLSVEADLEAVVEAVRAWLEGNDRWLLVLDNAEDPAVVAARAPRGGAGKVLITSRQPSWGALAAALVVGVLGGPEAASFLVRRSGDGDEAAAADLARELGRLPLALEQAGAYVDQTPGMTLAAYQSVFAARSHELLARPRPLGYEGTVATTWVISFEAVATSSPAGAELLQALAFVDADDIPLELITADSEHWHGSLGGAAGDPLRLGEALGALARFSLVTSAGAGLVSVHRLVQLVVRQRMADDERRRWSGAVVAALAVVFPSNSDDVASWQRCARLVSHALAATGHVDDADAPDGSGQLLDRVATYLQAKAQFGQARTLFERALAIDEAAYGPDHTAVATRLNNLASVLRDQGDLAGARSRFERALAIDEAAYGPDHTATRTVRDNLGSLPPE